MRESVAAYDIWLGVDRSIKLKLHEDPAFHWAYPSREIHDGTVFLWTAGGRPEVAAQVIAQGNRWIHMLSSLSSQPLSAERDGEPIWSPDKAGMTMQPVPTAPHPASAGVARLQQIRQMAREFDAAYFHRGEDRFSLRLLPRPLYRYGEPESSVVDGILFAFVDGTNPKLLLLFEARKSKNGIAWYYGIAPVTVHKARVTLRGDEVFSIPFRQPPFDPHGTLFNHERRIAGPSGSNDSLE